MKRYQQYSHSVVDSLGNTLESGLPFVDFLYSGPLVYHVVRDNEAQRLDLIAYAYYGDHTLWPLIAWYNGILDPLAVQTGTELTIPVNPVNLSRTIRPFTYQEE